MEYTSVVNMLNISALYDYYYLVIIICVILSATFITAASLHKKIIIFVFERHS